MTESTPADPGFLPEDWRDSLMAWLNKAPGFAEGATWCDGSVLIGIGDQRAWLKIYNGRVIDIKPEPMPFGSTFTLRAAEPIWKELLSTSQASIFNYTLQQRIVLEGNHLEFMRLSKMVAFLVEGLRAVCKEQLGDRPERNPT